MSETLERVSLACEREVTAHLLRNDQITFAVHTNKLPAYSLADDSQNDEGTEDNSTEGAVAREEELSTNIPVCYV